MGRKCSRIVTKTRIFVSWHAEEKWLNAMGAKGYRLADVDAFDYKFTVCLLYTSSSTSSTSASWSRARSAAKRC